MKFLHLITLIGLLILSICPSAAAESERWQLEVGTEKQGAWLKYFSINKNGDIVEQRFNDEPMVQPEVVSRRKATGKQISKLISESQFLKDVKAEDPSKAPNKAPLFVWRIGTHKGAKIVENAKTDPRITSLYKSCVEIIKTTASQRN